MTTDSLTERALASFTEHFGGTPTVRAHAPGRVELLGNHTDYNGGLVLASAINRFTVVVGRPIAPRVGRVHSAPLAQTDEFDLDAIERGPEGFWGRYVRGVCWALGGRGRFTSGFEAAIVGDVPLGAGLSSSASVQAAVAMFLLRSEVFQPGWPLDGIAATAMDQRDPFSRQALAQVLRRSENAFVGVASGILDQYSVVFGRQGHALMLDCQGPSHELVTLGSPAPAIVVCDSMTSRRLADGLYNQRREECQRVTAYFAERLPHKGEFHLCRVTLDELREVWDQLDPVGRRRARHVLTEHQRVRRGAETLRAGDLAAFGRLMLESHASSRDDFANSSPALDALIAAAQEAPGFLGGKLSGAGWAGCTVNFVEADQAEAFAEAVRSGYARRTGLVPTVHIAQAADGAFAHRIG